MACMPDLRTKAEQILPFRIFWWRHDKVFAFYIEAKHSPAQCGQFVLLPDIMTQTFQYSKQNTDSINSSAQMIMEYMNQKFDDYRNAGTAGKEIMMPGGQEIFADWIAEHYRKKDVRFFITNGFKIIPIRQFGSVLRSVPLIV